MCVDDFGMHEGVNSAALQLARAGRVHAVSCMVGAPHWQRSAVRQLLALGNVDIGLHLDFTEWPLQASARRSLPVLLAAGLWPALGSGAVRREIRAQLDAFERGTGRAPDHVDGHRHVHQFAAIRGELLDELARRYSGRLPWLRSTCSQAAGTKPRLIAALGGSALRTQAQQRGVRTNRGFWGVYDFEGGTARYAAHLDGWLRGAGDGDLLMCHPSARPHRHDPLGMARCAEFAVLAAPQLGRQLHAAGISLQPLSQVLG